MKNILLILTTTIVFAVAGFLITAAVSRQIQTSSDAGSLNQSLQNLNNRQRDAKIGGVAGAAVGLAIGLLLTAKLNPKNKSPSA